MRIICDDNTAKQISTALTSYLQGFEGSTPYCKQIGREFLPEYLEHFLYRHVMHVKDFEEVTLLNILCPDLIGIFFGRVWSCLRKVYNDQSDGEDTYEVMMMDEAIEHLQVLKCLYADWALDLIRLEVSRKTELGHFRQVPEEFEEFKNILG